MSSETSLSDAQRELVSRLAADPYFADIPVLSDRKADVATLIEKSLLTVSGKSGKCGVAAVVLQPIATVSSGNIPVPNMTLDLVIRVLENVLFNSGSTGTGKPAAAVARKIVDILHLYTAPGVLNIVRPKSQTIIPVEDRLAPVAYDVQFESDENPRGTRYVDYKCAQVAVAVTGDALPYTIALSCPTSGASIYYTLDGTYPGPQPGSTATLYTAAITLQTPCTLRAGAVKTAMIASDPTYASVS